MVKQNNLLQLLKSGFLVLLVLQLIACGGSPETKEGNYQDYEDVYVSSLVIEGHEIGFQANKAGPYYLTLSENSETLKFQAYFNNENEELELYYELKSGEASSGNVEIESGEVVEVNLQEGASLLEIKLYEIETVVGITYSIIIEKEAVLGQLSRLDLFVGEEALNLTPNFDPEIYEYEAQVTYGTCSYGFRFNSSNRNNQVRYLEANGERLKNLEYYQANLETGENYLDLYVSNYVGEGERRYTVTLHRRVADENQENKNANLKSLEIAGKDLDFYCSQGAYVIEVNRNVSQLTLRARPEVRGVGLFYGDNDFRADEDFEIVLDEDMQWFTVRAVSLDESVSRNYQIFLNRLSTNRHYVSTAEELQTALLNAQPNDEIVLQEGDYQRALNADEEVYFSSMRSGSALTPIILRSEDNDKRARMIGNGNGSLFSLQGDHWQIGDLDFVSADNAIAITNSSEITVVNIKTSNMLSEAIAVKDSNEVTIKDSNFYAGENGNSQQAQIVVASSAAGMTSDIVISRNTFESDGRYPGLKADENVRKLAVEANVFRNVDSGESASAQLTMDSSESEVRFNHFYPGESGGVPFQLSGYQVSIFENILERIESSSTLAQAETGGDLFAADNFLSWLSYDEEESEHEAVSYGGPIITVQAGLNKRFRLQAIERPDLCLGLIEHDSVDDFYFPVLQSCEQAEFATWQFKAASERYVYLKSPDFDEGYLTLPSDFYNYCENLLQSNYGSFLYDNVLGFAQQWAIDYNDEGVQLASKYDTSWVLTVGGGTYTPGNRIVGCPKVNSSNVNHARQTFRMQFVD